METQAIEEADQEAMPTRIMVMRVITYDVPGLMDELREDGNTDPDLDDVIERIELLCQMDFGCLFGHETDTNDLIWVKDDGEEL